MRIFLAGAAGVIGRQLVPMLIADGHAVHGTTRSAERAGWLRAAGATPVLLDAFDADAVREAVVAARPDVVIHELTDLAAGFAPEQLRANARLRIEGTGNLVAAMLAAGGGRLIAQSAAWLYAPGRLPHREADPLLDPAEHPENAVIGGILELERLTVGTPGIVGLVLRYGFLYGPGTVSETRGDLPSVHVAAAARAAALAVTRGEPGIYNVVDDGADVSNERARSLLGWDPEAR